MKDLKISTETLLKLTAVVDKLEVKDKLLSIEEATDEQVGREIIGLLITNLHKATNEVYDFIISYKGLIGEITIVGEEEMSDVEYDSAYNKEYSKARRQAIKKAKEYDVVSLFKEIMSVEGMKDFFS